MSRSARIAEIIDKRKPLAQRIETAIGNLEALRGELHSIDAKRDELLTKVGEEDVKEKLRSLDFRSPHDAITEQLVVLEKLRARFSDQTLNIGVVGLMGQGKSTLLQSITGLGDDVIPAKGGVGACTAVKSTICHRPGKPTEAKITLHSINSLFQEVILPHFKSEELALSPEPSDFQDFIHSPFPDYVQDDNNAWRTEVIERLKKDYYDQSSYRNFLGRPPETVSENDIKSYVSHFDPENNLNDYKNLAVKEVKIFCDFNNDDVGQIALVDIPGLGDHVLGDKELMLKALGEEVDIVLFVRRPDAIRASWGGEQTRLYGQAAKALSDLKSRSFMILNKITEDQSNEAICRRLQSQISETAIKVIDCLVSDCSNSEEAQGKVLDIILNYLTQNITALDLESAKSCQDNLQSIHKAVQKALEDSRKAFGDIDDDDYQDIEEIYSELFGDKDSGWWREITLRLQELRSEIWFQRQAPNNDLYEAFTEALNLCTADKGILSKENAIELINDQIKIVGAFRAYPDYQDELRVLISHRFLALDTSLQQTVEKMKTRVAKILKNVGKLEALSALDGTPFFDEMYDLVPDRYRILKEGFRIIAEFRLSYRGLILPRIRQHLDGLTSITAMAGHHGFAEPQEDQTLAVSANTTADEIFMALEIDYDKAIYRLKPALEELLCEPNEAVFAMVEEFIDNVIRQQGISNEWKNFLRRYKGKIWRDAFGEQEQARQVRKDWLDATKSLESFNQSQLFSFIQ